MYKMIATDLDGTLLNSYGQITEKTKDALLKAQDKGVYIVFASGRVSSSIKSFAELIGIKGYIISGNGALVTDLETNENIYTNVMDKNTVLKIISICEQNSISYNLYTLKDVYTKKIEYSTLFYHMENKKLPEEKKIKINLCENIEKLIKESNDLKISKITICDKDRMVFNSIIRKLREVDGVNVLDVSHSSRKVITVGTEAIEIKYNYTEVSKSGVDKWSAIEFLANKLNIDTNDIICIGDNANDIIMVENAGLGVIMGNAAPEYKERADFVTNSNDEEGVTNIINKYILNKE
ncbi:MAG: HAD family phosphatase [Clostridiales bacterium]|nr:HAD family phosphatase [Clostridiales bacterium]